MNVVFYNHDHTDRVQPPQPVTVEKYTWTQLGGPKDAVISAPSDADTWDLTKLLRCPVEIWGDDGRLNWWGYVNKVVVPYGDIRMGLGLDEMFNYVTVNGSAGATTAARDEESIREFGTKQMVLTDSNAT